MKIGRGIEKIFGYCGTDIRFRESSPFGKLKILCVMQWEWADFLLKCIATP